MSRDYFRFKSFGVFHGKDTLKVCTEACILGAIATTLAPQYVLDIGTGSGLLALMLAQRLPGEIDAVEIDKRSFEQAIENFSNAPWGDRLHAHHQSIIDYASNSKKKYDLIVSNPPFYSGHALARDKTDTITKHEVLLNQDQLSTSIVSLLQSKGKAYMLYPPHEMKLFTARMKALGLFPSRSIIIRNFKDKQPFRVINCFEKRTVDTTHEELVIYDEPGKYSQDFTHLLSSYYLIF